MTTSFAFSTLPFSQAEIDALACYSLEGDGTGNFHVACSTKSMELVSFLARAREKRACRFSRVRAIFTLLVRRNRWRLCRFSRVREKRARTVWSIGMKSRAWHVVASVPDDLAYAALFTAREDGHFHAYSIDGRPCWSHDFSGTVSEFKCYADPFTGERMLVIPSIDKTLRMLTANTGKLVWGDTFQSGANIVDQCLQADGETHVIAAGGNDHTMRCYVRTANDDASAYKMAWFHKFDSYVRDVSISPHGKIAAVADDGFVKIFDVSDGTVAWSHEHGSFAWKCRILEDDIAKVVSTSFQVPIDVDESGDKLGNPGIMACHDLASGNLLWQTLPEDGINVNAWDFHQVDGRWLVAVGTTGGEVVLLDVETGEVLQRYNPGHLINDVKFFEINDGRLAIIGCQESDNDSLFAGLRES